MPHVKTTQNIPKYVWALSRQEAVLVGITMIWGVTFLVVHKAMEVSGPFFFVGLRFMTAGTLSLLLFHRTMRELTLKELRAGSAIGIAIFLGYFLQTYGLKTITSSQSAFITALYVPIVPLLQWLILKRPPRLMSWLGIALAFTGLILLANPENSGLTLSVGETVTLISAIAIAAEIILIGMFANEVNSQRVTVVQLLVAGILSFTLMPVSSETIPPFSWTLVLSAMGLGLASAGIQLAMNWAQKSVSPTRATVIYAGEPVWAGFAGRLAGDRLPALALIGAGLIVAGVIVSELKIKWKKPG